MHFESYLSFRGINTSRQKGVYKKQESESSEESSKEDSLSSGHKRYTNQDSFLIHKRRREKFLIWCISVVAGSKGSDARNETGERTREEKSHIKQSQSVCKKSVIPESFSLFCMFFLSHCSFCFFSWNFSHSLTNVLLEKTSSFISCPVFLCVVNTAPTKNAEMFNVKK